MSKRSAYEEVSSDEEILKSKKDQEKSKNTQNLKEPPTETGLLNIYSTPPSIPLSDLKKEVSEKSKKGKPEKKIENNANGYGDEPSDSDTEDEKQFSMTLSTEKDSENPKKENNSENPKISKNIKKENNSEKVLKKEFPPNAYEAEGEPSDSDSEEKLVVPNVVPGSKSSETDYSEEEEKIKPKTSTPRLEGDGYGPEEELSDKDSEEEEKKNYNSNDSGKGNGKFK